MSRRFTLTFEPLDVLIFRDYRGLEAAEQHEARTLGATPTVMLGCVRGALFRQLGADFHSKDEHYRVKSPAWHTWLGGRSGPGDLTLRGPWVVGEIRTDQPKPWFPAPLGPWLRPADPPKGTVVRLPELARRHKALSPTFSFQPLGGEVLLAPTGEKDRCGPQLVSPDLRIRAADTFYCTERRIGIARDDQTHSVTEDLFFFQDVLRMQDQVGLAVEVTVTGEDQEREVRALHHQTVPLGGRGRRVLLRVHERSLLPEPPALASRVLFVTPVVLKAGHDLLPKGAEPDAFTTGEADTVGGWDLAHRRPRPLRSTLPAGTVLTLKTPTDLRDHRWGQDEADWRAGYGSTLLFGDSP